MLSLLILLVIIASGYLLVYKLLPEMPSVVQLATGWVVGVIIFGWLSLLLISALGYSTGLILTTLGLILAIFYTRRNSALSWNHYQSRITNFSLAAYLLCWIIIFGWLFNTHMMQPKADGLYSAGMAWGDMALHASFITNFASQTQLDLTSPIYAAHTTNYPFLFNFVTAHIYRGGLSLHLTLVIIGLLTSLASLVIMFHITWRLTKSHITAWIFSLLVMFNGGVGIYYWWQDKQATNTSWWNMITNPPIDYVHVPELNLHWSNFITESLIPQRGMLIGFAIFCLIILIWYIWWEFLNLKKYEQSKKIILFSALIVGLTPLFHVHVFIALWGCLVWLLGHTWWTKKLAFKEIISPLFIATFLGFAQIAWMANLTAATNSNTFVAWQLGWLAGSENLFMFWLRNMGLEFILILVGSVYFFWINKKYLFVKKLLAPLLVLFVMTNLILFQPNPYDNIKLMFLVHWMVVLALSLVLTEWWQQKKYILVSLVVLLMINVGVLAVVRESRLSWIIATNQEVTAAEQIKELTPHGSIFLTASNHNHLVPMLAGRPVVMGYPGWLWTHGIDYHQTENDVRVIYAGANSALQLIEQYKIDYIFVGPEERRIFAVNDDFLAENFEKILPGGQTVIFATN